MNTDNILTEAVDSGVIQAANIRHFQVRMKLSWRHDKKRQAYKLVRRLLGKPIPKMRCCVLDKLISTKWKPNKPTPNERD